MADIEARLVALERLAAKQQSQVAELRSHSKGLLVQLDLLHQKHRSLRESHLSLHKLVEQKTHNIRETTDVSEIRVTTKTTTLHWALDEWQVLLTVCQFLGAFTGSTLAQLVAVSRPYIGLNNSCGIVMANPSLVDKEQCKISSRNSAIHQLDHSVWSSINRHDPSRYKLDEWAKSQTVLAVLGCFGIDSTLGKTGSMKFSVVFTIFENIGLSMQAFVNKFRHIPSSGGEDKENLEEIATNILNRFACTNQTEAGTITCRDFFRLLELIGFSLQRFKSIFPTAATVFDSLGNGTPLVLGSYRMRRQIGQGFKGVRCYLGEHVKDGTFVAVKLPAPSQEVTIMKEIDRLAPKDCEGLPKLLSTGAQNGHNYIVTELLGSPLTKVLDRLIDKPFMIRWKALSVIGRLLVRRLEQLHTLGYVHCDMSPENILLGAVRGNRSGAGVAKSTLYLIDLELAQKYPGGSKAVEGTIGSAEWSSIRSADKVERCPEDDLEAVGWILMNGLYGQLPWFDFLASAYRDWDSPWTKEQTIKQVQRAKLKLLEDGWSAFGWRSGERIPEELIKFLRACRTAAGAPALPSYKYLRGLLGGELSSCEDEARQNDDQQFEEYVMKLL